MAEPVDRVHVWVLIACALLLLAISVHYLGAGR
jgi:hypothetical protein